MRISFHTVTSALLALGALFLGCARPAPLPTGTWKDTDYPVRTERLRSGLQFSAEEDDRTALASWVLVVAAGAADDPKGKEGLAHLVEHLVFRGRHEGDRTLKEVLEFSGAADANAVTTKDLTVYTAVVHRSSLPAVAAATHWLLIDPLAGIDEATFEAERSVVLAELRESSGLGAHGEVYDAVWATAFPETHPYSRPTGGTEVSLRALTLEDARAFAASHYRPENASVAISGGANPGAFARYLEQRFTHEGKPVARPEPAATAATPEVPASPALRIQRRNAPIADHELYLVWTLPRGYGVDGAGNVALLDLVQNTLDRLSHEDDDIESITVSHVPGLRASMLMAMVTLREGVNAPRTAQLLIERLEERLQTTAEVLKGEKYQAADRRTMAANLLASESPEKRSLERALRLQLVGDASTASATEELLAVPRETVLQRMSLLTRDRARAIYIHPSGSVRLPGNPLVKTAPVEAAKAEAPLTVTVPAEELKKFNVQSGVATQSRSERLANGMEIVAVKTRHRNTVSVTLNVPGGSSLAEPLGAADLGEAVTFRKDGTQRSPDSVGAVQSVQLGRDTRALTVRGQPQNLKGMLMWLERESDQFEVDAAVLPYLELTTYPRIEKFEARPQVAKSRAFLSTLYSQHPYGRTATVKDYVRLVDWQIESWMERAHGPGAAVLAIVGDIDPAEALTAVKEVFGDWKNDQKPIARPPAARAPEGQSTQVLYADVKDATQASVELGCLLPPADEHQALVHDVLAAALQGSLTRDLRDRAGVTYGVHVHSAELWGGTSHLTVETSVFGEDLARVLTSLKERLAQGGARVDPMEVERARWDVLRTRNLVHLTTFRLSRTIAATLRNGHSLASVDNVAEEVASVTPAEVDNALELCRRHWVVLITGAQAVTEKAALTTGWAHQAP